MIQSCPLGRLPLWLSAMLRILSRLWKIGVRILQHGILIAVPKLSLHADVPGAIMILGLNRALRQILIDFILRHDSTSSNEMKGLRYR
jgi:hypothetical protein